MNTYQAVLTTDGISTFVMFLYRDIQWSGNATGTGVGFNAGDGIRGFNLFDSLFNISDILNLELASNIGDQYPGVYFFRVDLNIIVVPGQGEL